MKQNHIQSPGARADEQASPSTSAAASRAEHAQPVFTTNAEREAYWHGVNAGIRAVSPPDDAPARPVAPGGEAPLRHDGRRYRHDGWTPAKLVGFIERLAGCGVVADACRAVGMSVASAYAHRNRRAGRAWGMAWDAVLIHRARGRLSDDVMSRALDGCVDQLVKEGEVVAERRRHDNRLSMAVLTRLDRLAERSRDDQEAETLRAVSEDLDAFLDCVEEGGDADAFVEARRPAEPEAVSAPARERDDLDMVANVMGISSYRDVHPFDIPVDDLDLDLQHEWDMDAWIRADRSGYLVYVDIMERSGVLPAASKLLARFQRQREMRRNPEEPVDGREHSLADPACEDASCPSEPDQPGAPVPPLPSVGAGEEDSWQPSTSSTSPAAHEEQATLPHPSERPEPRIRTFDW